MTDHQEQPSARPPAVIELRRDELEVAVSIFRKLSVGEDPRQLAQTAAGQSLYIKLVRARERDR